MHGLPVTAWTKSPTSSRATRPYRSV